MRSTSIYETFDPVPGDVPIQLNNKGFFAWFEPICKLYMLPKYNELDLDSVFAPFFMVFFGLCLGDSVTVVPGFTATLYRLFAKNISDCDETCNVITGIGGIHFLLRIADGTFFGANIYDIDPPFFQKMKNHVHGQ